MQLSKDTLNFLAELAVNNNREWFLENKARFDTVWQGMKELVQQLILGLSEFDTHIHRDIDASRCLFRIYRDTRFSKDKTPYKLWLGAGISVNGRKLHGPEYYLHIQPGGKSFIAVGYWRPEKDHLAAIRQEIDYNGQELNQILEELEGAPKPIALNRNEKLIRPPIGYMADHPDIELLKLKSFTLSYPIRDEEVSSDQVLSVLLENYRSMLPFKSFLHQAIGQE
ncbi:MAG TPA: DUF2461 domain-containing protein [Sphingobacteriaceae bacterium]|nr:DUF2461 domain-containing protein [Sphingobacteriaceae bacterium]